MHIIKIRAGKGGDGCVSFRREKFVPKGGPDGGDGGRGGSVIIEADPAVESLEKLPSLPELCAEDGENGKSKGCKGKDGKDLIIKVPPWTLVYDYEKKILLKDLNRPGMQITIARGGRGGKGNKALATSRNRTPAYAQKGEEGEKRIIALELKCLADVGIIGLPNSGKSTLLSKLSKARPKIGDYLFTTLIPNLGVIEDEKSRTLTIADLPGIIEGAHKGKGLGSYFLRHVERTRVLLHLIDVSANAIKPPHEAYKIIRSEIASYSSVLSDKPEIVVANKIDLPGWKRGVKLLKETTGKEVISISALKGTGLQKLKKAIWATAGIQI